MDQRIAYALGQQALMGRTRWTRTRLRGIWGSELNREDNKEFGTGRTGSAKSRLNDVTHRQRGLNMGCCAHG